MMGVDGDPVPAMAAEAEIAPLLSQAIRLLDEERFAPAITLLSRLVDQYPGAAQPRIALCRALRKAGRLNEAVMAGVAAVSYAPGDARAFMALDKAFFAKRDFAKALACCRRALELAPGLTFLWARAIHLSGLLADWQTLDEDRRRAAGQGGPPFALLSQTSSASEHQVASRLESEWLRRGITPYPPRPPSSEGRIRVGYLSYDFYDHATSYLAAGLFEHHDRSRFEVYGYSLGPDDGSDLRSRLVRAFDRFADLRGHCHEDAAARIRADGIDVLIDMSGHTRGNGLKILAWKPAPIQVHFLTYPGTLGHADVDYLIADPFVVPAELAKYYDEHLVHMPDCYQINDDRRPLPDTLPSRAECGLPEGAFVFCCFNNTYKLNPEMFDIWSRLLHGIPGSVLWLLGARPEVSANLRAQAKARGVEPDRLIFARRLPIEQHLARQALADLCLDTFPYGAHTTAADALWMGVPVVTLVGEGFPSRVAGSLLNAVGQPELITTSYGAYEALALALARDKGRLQAIRTALQRNRRSSPLFDTARFTRNLEAAFTIMVERWRQGRSPSAIVLPSW